MLVHIIRFFLFLFIFGVCPGGLKAQADEGRVVLFAAGDTMLARWMHNEAGKGSVDQIFSDTLPFIRNADIAFVNLECLISDKGRLVAKGERRPFHYRARPEMVRFLKEAGIDIVSQANNHAGDYGPNALLDSMEILKVNGILPVGVGAGMKEASATVYTVKNGVRLAWIAFATEGAFSKAKDGLPGIFYVKEEKILEVVGPLVEEANKNADIVIVTAHWGANWKDVPSSLRQKAAKGMVDLGADLILGHSSHMLQGMEVYKNKPIIYDMGSFLFDSVSDVRLRDSMFFQIEISKDGVDSIKAVPTRLSWRKVGLDKDAKGKQITAQKFIQLSQNLSKNEFLKFIGQEYVGISLGGSKLGALSAIGNGQASQGAMIDNSSKPNTVFKSLPFKVNEDVNFTLPNGIELKGVELPSHIEKGKAFVSRIFFTTQKDKISNPGTISLILYEQENGNRRDISSYTYEPGDWSYPVNRWQKGEIILDEVLFRISPHLDVGKQYAFILRWVSEDGKSIEIPLALLTVIPSLNGSYIPGLVAYESKGDSLLIRTKSFELIALRYADDSLFNIRNIYLEENVKGKVPFAWLFYLLRFGSQKVLIDTGFRDEVFRERWGLKGLYSPQEVLASVGESLDSITDVVITHAHMDHMGNLDLFKNAKVYVQEDEFREALEDKKLAMLIKSVSNDRLVLFKEELSLSPRILLRKARGHTKGTVVVDVKSRKDSFLLTSDNCYLIKNCHEKRYTGSAQYTGDLKKFIDSLESYKGNILTHHDPLIFKSRGSKHPFAAAIIREEM